MGKTSYEKQITSKNNEISIINISQNGVYAKSQIRCNGAIGEAPPIHRQRSDLACDLITACHLVFTIRIVRSSINNSYGKILKFYFSQITNFDSWNLGKDPVQRKFLMGFFYWRKRFQSEPFEFSNMYGSMADIYVDILLLLDGTVFDPVFDLFRDMIDSLYEILFCSHFGFLLKEFS